MAAGDANAKRIAAMGSCVSLKGGPHDGSWYTVADWEITREAERLMLQHENRQPVMARYVETKDIDTDNRSLPGLVGRVWRFKREARA